MAAIQDKMLKTIIDNKTNVTIFLMNGFQMKGTVTGYDQFVIILESDGKQNMIYKHAVSTIRPDDEVTITA